MSKSTLWASVVSVYVTLGLLWYELEKLIYGYSQTSIVDSVMGFLVAYLLVEKMSSGKGGRNKINT